MDFSSSSLADISLLLLADAAVPQYASAIVAALVTVNQTLKSQVDTIQADLRSIRESIEELKTIKKEQRNESCQSVHNQGNDSSEQNNSGAPNKRDLAFSVYLREMKSEPSETGNQRGNGMEEEEEEDEFEDEMNEEYEEDEEQPGTSTAAPSGSMHQSQPDFNSVAAALLPSLLSSFPGLATQFSMHPPTTVSSPASSSMQQEQPGTSTPAAAAAREDSATPGSSKRIILPCPRSGCEVLLYSQLGFSAHLRIHDGKMPFECTNCGREFRLRDGLVKHMRTHTGERPYPCQVCGKNFKRIHHRKKHLQQHIGPATETPTV
ncbi:hypothetical protein PMAYCL1PPCAC_07681, partial [Pristionchus mayeri]